MPRPRRHQALLVAVAALLVGCSSGASTTETPTSPTTDAPATGAPSTDGAGEEDPGTGSTAVGLGDALDPTAVAPRAPGVAWQVEDAVLLTTTSGTPIGHLPGWSLDGARSDRMAAPVVVAPDGGVHVITQDALVPIDGPLPLADRHHLLVEDGAAVVRGPDDAEVARLELVDAADLWVSATGTVIGAIDGASHDVEAGGPAEVPNGCRLADRHEVDAPLFVCDDGSRLAGGIDLPAPDGARFGWVTVGTTGDEVLATIRTGDALGLVLASRATGESEVRGAPEPTSGTAGLFWRSSGAAWIASHLGGTTTTLQVLDPAGATSDVREVPGATDAMMWTR